MRYAIVGSILVLALLVPVGYAQEGPYEVLPWSVGCFPYATCMYIGFGVSYYAAMNISCYCGDTLDQQVYSWPSISVSINVVWVV